MNLPVRFAGRVILVAVTYLSAGHGEETIVRLATWNLNNRVGKVRFRPEAANAAAALNADAIVLTEYYPQRHHRQFCRVLADSGLKYRVLSTKPAEIANRTLIVSRFPMVRDDLALPAFDNQFPANTVAAIIPSFGLRILGLRVPAYLPKQRDLLLKSWAWLEDAATSLRNSPAIILGDLNVGAVPKRSGKGEYFLRILESGWQRAAPAAGYSYLGHSGHNSEIDHMLHTSRCHVHGAEYVTELGDFIYAGTRDALSDHAALVATVEVKHE